MNPDTPENTESLAETPSVATIPVRSKWPVFLAKWPYSLLIAIAQFLLLAAAYQWHFLPAAGIALATCFVVSIAAVVANERNPPLLPMLFLMAQAQAIAIGLVLGGIVFTTCSGALLLASIFHG